MDQKNGVMFKSDPVSLLCLWRKNSRISFLFFVMLYDMIYDINIIIVVVIVISEAHMFWWHYKSPYRVEDSSKPWPIILWLQGGPVSIT